MPDLRRPGSGMPSLASLSTGVCAVPGWSSKGNYAEWYQQGLQTTDTARQKFHKAKFGEQLYDLGQ